MKRNDTRQMQTNLVWQEWVWLGLGMRLPPEWEMLQFSRNQEIGKCMFADRYQYRLELNWKKVPAAPDMERMIADYKAKLAEQGMQNLRKTGCSPWQGITGLAGENEISRYGRFMPENNLILEAVFIWPPAAKARPAEEGKVLASIKAEPTSPDSLRTWKAFAMTWRTPVDWSFQDCDVSAMQTGMTFAAANGREKLTFARHAMVSQWLTIPVAEWLEDNLPPAYQVESSLDSVQSGHTVSSLVAIRERPVLPDWLHGRRLYQACAWICPQKQRLFCLVRWGHQSRKKPLEVPISALSCCSELEVKL